MSLSLRPGFVVLFLAALTSVVLAQQGPTFPSAANLTPLVTVTATPGAGPSLFDFAYTIANATSSKQAADKLILRYDPALSIKIMSTPPGWLSNEHIGDGALAGWTALTRGLVRPGRQESGFVLRAVCLPGIVDGFVSGFIPVRDLPKFPEGSAPEDTPGAGIIENSVRLRVLGPVAAPSIVAPLAFIQSIISYKEEAIQQGWIKNQGTGNSLDAKLNAAHAAFARGDNKTAVNILQALLNEIDAQTGKQLAFEAAALLKFNTQYLISKL